MHRLALLALVAGCGGPRVHDLTTDGPLGSPAPSTALGSVLYATATLGSTPAPLLVDTGAPLTVLQPTRLPSANIPAGPSTLPSLALADLTLHSVPVLAVEIFPPRPGFAPAGILGATVLCQFTSTLDYRAATLRLAMAPPSGVPDVAAPVALPLRLEGGGTGTLAGQSFAYPATRIPVTATIDGTARTLILDTGSSYLVLRDALFTALVADGRSRLEGVPILSADGPLDGKLTRARTVEVAGQSVAAPPVLDIGDSLLDAFAAEVHHPIDGLLGGVFLREFLLTLDFPNHQILLQRYATRDHIDPHEFHQVAVTLEPAPANSAHRFRISHVYPNTAAAAAGLSAGQLLIAVDAASTDTLGTDETNALLHGPVGTMRTLLTDQGTFPVPIDDLLPPP